MTATTHLMVIYSCRQFEATRVHWQSQTWPRRTPAEIELITMTGGGDNNFDQDGVLRLQVEDDYNSLIDKTQALIDWFVNERSEPWLVKCDDDVWLSPSALQKIVANTNPYAGAYGEVCASGPLYVIHRELASKLGRLRNYPSNSLAEDLAVGAAAADAGYRTKSLNLGNVYWYNHKEDVLQGPHEHDMIFSFYRDNHQEMMSYAEENYVAK